MCILIDVNTLSAVFDPTNARHDDFRPVAQWILHGRGKVVYGGSTYTKEAFVRIRRFNRLFSELRRLGKAVVLPREEVDEEERRVRAIESSADFDDPHVIAIVEVSGCLLFCSDDKRADRFVKANHLYHKRSCPKIYREASHRDDLLNDTHIAECCLPHKKLVRADSERLSCMV